jgi:hypothetical protein
MASIPNSATETSRVDQSRECVLGSTDFDALGLG